MAKQPPKNPPQSAEELVQKIHLAEQPMHELAAKLNAKNKEIQEWREAHPELLALEEEGVALYAEFREAGRPLTDLFGQLSQIDPGRFAQEMKRIRETGLQYG